MPSPHLLRKYSLHTCLLIIRLIVLSSHYRDLPPHRTLPVSLSNLSALCCTRLVGSISRPSLNISFSPSFPILFLWASSALKYPHVSFSPDFICFVYPRPTQTIAKSEIMYCIENIVQSSPMYLRIIYVGEGWMRCEGQNVAGDEENESGRTRYDLMYTKESARWATEAENPGGT